MTPTEAKEQINEVAQKLYDMLSNDPFTFGQLYLPHHFPLESPGFHGQILLEAFKSKFFSCAAPRGSAKSTIVAFLIPAHAIVFKRKRFILIVSNTYKKAANTLESIKREIRENAKLKKDFKINITKDAEGESIFRHPDGFEIRVLCKGNEQMGTVRGEKFGAYRPDMIIVDDLEDDELVKNPIRRKDLKDLYDEALIPAVDVAANFQVLVIGTILHDDSLMARLVSPREYREYNKLFYKALYLKDGNFISLWPQKYSVAWLRALQKKKPSVFAKEYQNDPSYGILGVFKKEFFRYWTVEENNYVLYDEGGHVAKRGPLSQCKAAISCDLAWEEKRQSDFSVIMPAFLTPQNDILVDNYLSRKGMRPSELEEYIFALDTRLKGITGHYVPVGMEKAKLEKVVSWLLKKAMRKRNHYLSLRDLEWDRDKITRIENRLEGRYAMNAIYHKRNMGDLEDQLLRLRSAAHDDLADALQGVVQLLEYPRKAKVHTETKEDAFMRLRKFAINSRKRDRRPFTFGNRGKWFRIPAEVCPV
jgi:hypothetical protein